jgi:ribonuclease P protein component
VFKGAERLSNRDFTLLSAARPDAPGRLGLAVSKKQLRRAVDRNRFKRLIRETYRQRHSELPGRDIVVMVRGQAVSRSNVELFRSLQRLFVFDELVFGASGRRPPRPRR